MHRLFGTIALMAAAAQAQPGAADFEVASVKPSAGGPQGVWNEGSHERLRMLNMTLKSIVAEAYGIKDHNVFGPPWLDSDRFEIIAKVSPETAKLKEPLRNEAMRGMAQRLLADRFKLQVHRETREMPVYVLTAMNGGVKISQTGPPSNDWVRATVGRGSLTAKQMPMAQLLSILGGVVHRQVLDESGIRGVFDIQLEWSPDDLDAAAGAAKPDKPSLFTALQEQCGLKLEFRKAPTEVIVVDHAEQPSGN